MHKIPKKRRLAEIEAPFPAISCLRIPRQCHFRSEVVPMLVRGFQKDPPIKEFARPKMTPFHVISRSWSSLKYPFCDISRGLLSIIRHIHNIEYVPET